MPAIALLALTLVTFKEPRIFDGKTLDGWKVVGGGKWEVEKGVLIGSCTKTDEQGILVYKDPVKDFDASLKFRISEGNSGFYFRTELIDKQPLVRGFQAEIDAIEDVAGIWETDGRGWIVKPDATLHAKTKFKPGAWSDLKVQVRGDHYKIWLNGVVTADIVDPVARKEGAVALQLHGNVDMKVEFKDIRLAQR
ncbi:MAG: 3-keto-disaccharide hydrolase [Fimbriimonas sp.]